MFIKKKTSKIRLRTIYFTNGNVTKYVYSATGQKLRVIYQTAVPNISVAMGSTRELAPSEILYADSTEYLMGGILTLRNGRIDKYLFSEGYCQAERQNNALDGFTFYYYNRDHLGNNREVIDSDGNVCQRTDYYPYGTPFSAPSDGINARVGCDAWTQHLRLRSATVLLCAASVGQTRPAGGEILWR